MTKDEQVEELASIVRQSVCMDISISKNVASAILSKGYSRQPVNGLVPLDNNGEVAAVMFSSLSKEEYLALQEDKNIVIGIMRFFNFATAIRKRFGKPVCTHDYLGQCPECKKFGHIKLRCDDCNKPTPELPSVESIKDALFYIASGTKQKAGSIQTQIRIEGNLLELATAILNYLREGNK